MTPEEDKKPTWPPGFFDEIRMSPEEIAKLASGLPGADPATAAKLKEEIARGFYGEKTSEHN